MLLPEDDVRRVSTCMGLCYRNPLSDAVHKSYSCYDISENWFLIL